MATHNHQIKLLMTSETKRANPWLCFTALENNCVIQLNKNGDPDAINLKTSMDGVHWDDYSWDNGTGRPITLDAGQKVYWRGDYQTFSKSGSDYYRFIVGARANVEGSVMSLIGQSVTSLHDYCFLRLFRGCTKIETAPKLPALYLGTQSYVRLFDGCTSIREATIDAEMIGSNALSYMFNQCSSLNSVKVRFKTWPTINNWLNGVAQEGTFYCPDELPDPPTRGASTVPLGWTIVRPIDGYVKDGLVFQLDSKVGKTATTWTDLIGGVVLDEYGNAGALNFPPGYTIEVCSRGVIGEDGYYVHNYTVEFGEGKAYLNVEASFMSKILPGGQAIRAYGHWVKTNEIEEHKFGNIGTNQEVVTISAPTTGQTIHVNGNAVTLDAGTNTGSGGTSIDTDLLSVRVYNRALTDDERLQNYHTDQQRFG